MVTESFLMVFYRKSEGRRRYAADECMSVQQIAAWVLFEKTTKIILALRIFLEKTCT
jgi:hypothetical protein